MNKKVTALGLISLLVFSSTLTIPNVYSENVMQVAQSQTQTTLLSATLDLEIVDQLGTRLTEVLLGSQVLIKSTITNLLASKQPFINIVQIKDGNGVTVLLSWVTGELSAKESLEITQSWTPNIAGVYTIEVFVWESIDKPLALSPQRTTDLKAGLLSRLPGPPSDPANVHIPDIPFPDPPAEDIVAPDGIPISVRDLIIIFKDTTTVREANALLRSLPALIVGGNPWADLLLIRLVGDSDLERVLNTQQRLLLNPLVIGASINHALAVENLPAHNVDTDNNRWTWELPLNDVSGNWGLKMIRMPQVWNLFDYAMRINSRFSALVVETDEQNNVANSTHTDLEPRVNVFAGIRADDHATMVAGIIGAIWNNNIGVEGTYPRELTIVSRGEYFWGSLVDTVIRVLNVWRDVRVVNYSAGMSSSYAKHGIDPVTHRVDSLDPRSPTWRDKMNNDGNTLLNAIQAFETDATGRSDFLMFCSAGNERWRPSIVPHIDYEARDNSECANIAVRGGHNNHFIAVEAIDSDGDRAYFSASGGTLSAPGECVRSTEANDDVNFDRDDCPANDMDDPNYATNSGTSFATPHTAGLALFLWSLDSELTYQQIRQIITATENRVMVEAGPEGGAAGSERIDAFATAIGIDLVSLDKEIQEALVDVDDGTYDGNLRRDPFTGESFTQIDTEDRQRGDGIITMRDFRTYRDAYLQVHKQDFNKAGLAVFLDGLSSHFKKDLSFDGCVDKEPVNPSHPVEVSSPDDCSNAPDENVYPRYDFNGNGNVSSFSKTSPFKLDPDTECAENTTFDFVAPPGCLRDIDVMGNSDWQVIESDNYEEYVFVDAAREGNWPDNVQNPHFWAPHRYLLGNRDGDTDAPQILKDLPDYLHSFDIHIKIDWKSVNADYDEVLIRTMSEKWPGKKGGNDDPFVDAFQRVRAFPRGNEPSTFIVTIPLWTGKVKVTWEGIDNDAQPPSVQVASVEWADVRFGEDRALIIP